ncbi:MAG: hypothetical protein B5M53_05880 [Candidatus Cloacimonas sp. 4484_209]|nr:MAG: hypothetical protein B5M53_05880 [Candidatus Cloacimonas sp. 4484_209]
MKKYFLSVFLIMFVLGTSVIAEAEKTQLSACEILKRVDNVLNAPEDESMKMKLILTDSKGREKEREIMMFQKGADKRIGKFLSPPDKKGIGFLSLPDDVMYIYLPAFKKIRRIAGYVKNTKFAGTDFTYEDMEVKRYSEKWTAEVASTDSSHCILTLKPKKGVKTAYSIMIMTVDRKNFYPTRIEFYKNKGKLVKILKNEKIKKINGYWVAKQIVMEDVKKHHKTTMILQDVHFNVGLSDDKFTKRYLQR